MVVKIIAGEGQDLEEIFMDNVKTITKVWDGAEIMDRDDVVTHIADPEGALITVFTDNGVQIEPTPTQIGE